LGKICYISGKVVKTKGDRRKRDRRRWQGENTGKACDGRDKVTRFPKGRRGQTHKDYPKGHANCTARTSHMMGKKQRAPDKGEKSGRKRQVFLVLCGKTRVGARLQGGCSGCKKDDSGHVVRQKARAWGGGGLTPRERYRSRPPITP